MAVTLPTYDSSKVSSLTLSTTQLGYSTSIANTWTSDTSPAVALTQYTGLSFDFSITNESERGLALAPTRPFTNITLDLAGTGETSNFWTLTIPTDITNPAANDPIQLYGVTSPATWTGTANHPYLNFSTLNKSYLIDTINSGDSEFVLNGSVYDLTFSLDFLSNYTETTAGAAVLNPLAALINNGSWDGLVQFVLHSTALATFEVTGGSFAGSTNRFHTGTADQPHNRRARSVHDYKTGEQYLSDEAVPDGYLHGIMVHPNNFDPVDPLEDDPYTPPPDEGVVEDEIINLE